jgi:hypothetical protein
VAARPSAEDLAAWQGLQRAALAASRAPRSLEAAASLARARKRSRNRVLPADQQRRDAPVCQLAFAADRWATLQLGEREAQADQLAALAVAAAQPLGLLTLDGEAAPQPAPAIRPRADIDG